MAARGYFPRAEFRRVFSEAAVRVLEQLAEFADVVSQQSELQAAVEAITEDVEDAELSLTSLDARVDVFENLAPFVRQDQTPAWVDATGTETRTTFSTYAGQVVSNPPTQAEVQAIDDHVKVLSERLAALINDLREVGALT
jgi:hypothetical protein